MFVPDVNNEKVQISKINRFYKSILEEMDQADTEALGEVRVGEDHRDTEERSTPHTRDIEAEARMVPEQNGSEVEHSEEKKRSLVA